MFTQLGLDSVWREAKANVFANSPDVQIICDSANERCLKIYMHLERRSSYFSSKRPSHHSNQPFSLWVRMTHWEPSSMAVSDFRAYPHCDSSQRHVAYSTK